MTDAELRDHAVALLQKMETELQATTDSYPRWVQRGRQAGHWKNVFQYEADALAILKQIGSQPVPIPPQPVPIPPPSGLVGAFHGAYIDGATMSRYYGSSYAYTVPDDPNAIVQLQFEKDAGKSIAVSMFGAGDGMTIPFWASTATPAARLVEKMHIVQSRGAYSLYDIATAGIYLKDIADGKYDAAITAWFSAAKAYAAPWMVRLNTEMNLSNWPWGRGNSHQPGTQADHIANFKNAWVRIWQCAQNAGANTNLSWHWAPNCIPPWDDNGTIPFKEYYPGDQYVDWAGFVCYQWQSSVSDGDWWYLSAPSYRMCLEVAPSKPQMVSEWSSYYEFASPPKVGSGTDANKGQWLQHALEHVRDHQPAIRAMVIFNTGYVGAESNQIETSQAAMAGYKAGISDPVYLGKQTSMATSGKVPVPTRG